MGHDILLWLDDLGVWGAVLTGAFLCAITLPLIWLIERAPANRQPYLWMALAGGAAIFVNLIFLPFLFGDSAAQ
jgi:hypothetical protein